MPTYEKPTAELIKEFCGETLKDKKACFKREEIIAWFAEKYPKTKKGTINTHLHSLATNDPNRKHYARRKTKNESVRESANFLFRIAQDSFRLYDAETDPLPL